MPPKYTGCRHHTRDVTDSQSIGREAQQRFRLTDTAHRTKTAGLPASAHYPRLLRPPSTGTGARGWPGTVSSSMDGRIPYAVLKESKYIQNPHANIGCNTPRSPVGQGEPARHSALRPMVTHGRREPCQRRLGWANNVKKQSLRLLMGCRCADSKWVQCSKGSGVRGKEERRPNRRRSPPEAAFCSVADQTDPCTECDLLEGRADAAVMPLHRRGPIEGGASAAPVSRSHTDTLGDAGTKAQTLPPSLTKAKTRRTDGK